MNYLFHTSTILICSSISSSLQLRLHHPIYNQQFQQLHHLAESQNAQHVLTSLNIKSESLFECDSPCHEKIPILFENKHFLAIDKPAGVPYHDSATNPGVLTLFRRQYPSHGRLYGVHRLDKVTSGIVVFAKSSQMAGLLSKAFRNKDIKKYYVAVSAKKPKKKKMGLIRGNMIRGRRGTWLLTREENVTNENWAESRFYTAGLGLLPVNEEGNATATTIPKTAILFHPITGKTHQLRVASKSVGLPILGDSVYGGSVENCDRTYLHATALHFDLDGQNVSIVSKPNFSELWTDQGVRFEGVVKTLMLKYCICQDILEKIEEQHWGCDVI